MNRPSREGLREISRLAFPIIASMASATVAGFVDTWMVALVVTAEIEAAMPAGITAYTLTAFPLGVTQCVSTFAAQALGRGEPREGASYAWQGLYLSLLVGLGSFLLWPAAPWFFSLFGHEPEIVALEVMYFRVRLWGVLIVLLVGRFGKEQLAASNIAIQYMTISFMPGIGLAQALTALVGRYIGAGKTEVAIQRVNEGLMLALSYMTLMGLMYVTLRGPFIAFFNTDVRVIQAGKDI